MSLSKPLTVPQVNHRDMKVPTFIYGTAWKEEATASLTRLAVEEGFVGIDTANQAKHYSEEGVGKAIKSLRDEGLLSRGDIFIQSKFTGRAGQDHRLPYDENAKPAEQVQQSMESSLEHLNTSYLDSYLLHGPSHPSILTDTDWEIWRTMEGLQESGYCRLIGISNVTVEQLKELIKGAKHTPAFVQNRCYARFAWDREVRELCSQHDILYQGFSLLTANLRELQSSTLNKICQKLGVTIPQAVFRFALDIGMIPLTGTTDPSHMQEDLEIYSFHLDTEDVKAIEHLAEPA